MRLNFEIFLFQHYELQIIFLKGSEKIYRNGFHLSRKRLQEMINLAVSFGASEQMAKQEMEKCLLLEKQLSKVCENDLRHLKLIYTILVR